MLREIGTVHRATDPPLRKKARAEAGDVTKKSVIEVTKSGGKIFFSLGSQEQSQTATWLRVAKALRARSCRKATHSETGRWQYRWWRTAGPALCDKVGRRK